MIALTRLTDYAIIVLGEFARPGVQQLSAAEAATRSGLPRPTVSKLLKTLARAGIVSSSRGVAGGYQLARSAGDLSLLEVIEAMDGPIAITECAVASSRCDRSGFCSAQQRWAPINRAIRLSLEGLTLADLFFVPAPQRPAPAKIEERLRPRLQERRQGGPRHSEED